MIIEILKDKKVIGEINFPEKAQEVKLNKFIDFEFNMKNLYSDILEGLSNEEIANMILSKKYESVRHMELLSVVCDFLSIERDMLISLSIDDLRNLLANIVLIVYNYTPPVITSENNTFTYKEDLWHLPYFTNAYQLHLGNEGTLNPGLRTGDIIEIQESIRILDSNSEKKEDKASYQFMKYLTILSVLAIKEGEILPGTLNGIKQRKDERMKYFEDIDMVTGLNADFFLGCTLQI